MRVSYEVRVNYGVSVGVSFEGSCEVMVDGHFLVKFGADNSEVVVEDWEEGVMVG